MPELAAEQLADIIFGTYGSSFAANVGQAPKDVQFLSQDNGVSFLFTSDAFALLLPQPVFEMSALAAVASAETPTPAFEALDAEIPPPPDPSEAVIVQVSFLGANSGVLAIGQEPLSIQFGMYVGDNPEQLLDRVPLFGLISYPDLYPGIDLGFAFDGQQRMKSIFTVEPGADPAAIRLRYSAVGSLALDEAGNLSVSTVGGVIQESAPVAYQLKEGQRLDIPIGFQLNQNDVTFSVLDTYDPSLPLVIDPVLSYSTYLSEPQGEPVADFATDVALPSWCPPYLCDTLSPLTYDQAWSVYVAGTTDSWEGPRGTETFVARLRTEGKEVLTDTRDLKRFGAQEMAFWKPVGTEGHDRSRGLAVGPDGSAYLVGRTEQNNGDAFLAKVSLTGG
ncbi:MAG: hypothetical protein MUO23_07310, partial [Anaerolineales bacterium]|nr:hypothetical protein [Anaerolineales bacterium]